MTDLTRLNKKARIRNAFDTLRQLCDPRGFDLLDALEELCLLESEVVDVFTQTRGSIDESAVRAEVAPQSYDAWREPVRGLS